MSRALLTGVVLVICFSNKVNTTDIFFIGWFFSISSRFETLSPCTAVFVIWSDRRTGLYADSYWLTSLKQHSNYLQLFKAQPHPKVYSVCCTLLPYVYTIASIRLYIFFLYQIGWPLNCYVIKFLLTHTLEVIIWFFSGWNDDVDDKIQASHTADMQRVDTQFRSQLTEHRTVVRLINSGNSPAPR